MKFLKEDIEESEEEFLARKRKEITDQAAKYTPHELHQKWLDDKEELEYSDIHVGVLVDDDRAKERYIDWTYSVPIRDIIEYVLQDYFPDKVLDLSEDDYETWVEKHYEEYLEKYKNKVLDYFEDQAKEEAQDEYAWD